MAYRSQVICGCLDDEVVEVREMAATTLCGIIRCSPKRSVLMLKVCPKHCAYEDAEQAVGTL